MFHPALSLSLSVVCIMSSSMRMHPLLLSYFLNARHASRLPTTCSAPPTPPLLTTGRAGGRGGSTQTSSPRRC